MTGQDVTVARLSPLQRRLDAVAAQPERKWLVALENVPLWETQPMLPEHAGASGVWSYESSRGMAGLVAEVCAREAAFGRSIEEESVIVTHGALYALGLIFRQLHADGFRVAVCQAPLLGAIGELLTASGFAIQLAAADWLLDVVEQVPVGVPAMVYVNTPHNPTGHVLPAQLVDEILRVADARPLRLVVDSVYDSFDFTHSSTSVSTLPALHPALLTVNSVSKNYGAPGLRVGWITGERATLNELTVRLEYETIAVSGPSQHYASVLIRNGNAELVDRVRRGRELIEEWWAQSGRSQGMCGAGGVQAWVPVPFETDITRFSDYLFHEFGLVLVGSESYVGEERPHVRIPYGYSLNHLRDVTATLDKAFATFS